MVFLEESLSKKSYISVGFDRNFIFRIWHISIFRGIALLSGTK